MLTKIDRLNTAVFLAGSILYGGLAFAEADKKQDTQSPQTPLLYSHKQNKKKEYQPPKTPNLYSQNPESYNQGNFPYIGFRGGVGYSSKGGDSKDGRNAYGFNLNLGYVKSLNVWSRLDASFEISINNQFGYELGDIKEKYGLLIKFGYSYNMSKSIQGLMQVGAGFGKALFRGEDKAGDAIDSEGDLDTLTVSLGFHGLTKINDSLDILAGLVYNNKRFNLDKVKKKGNSTSISDSHNYHLWELSVGLRYTL